MQSIIMARSYTPRAKRNNGIGFLSYASSSRFGTSQVYRRMEAVSLLSIAASLLDCQGGV